MDESTMITIKSQQTVKRIPDLVKIQDFQKNLHLINVNINSVGIIARIGDLKFANCGDNKDKVESVPIRELQLYDESFTIIRFILRNYLAESCECFKVNDILFLKNVRVMRIQKNFLILTTVKETVIDVNVDAPEVFRLKHWYLLNKKEIHSSNFEQFYNLSMASVRCNTVHVKDVTSSTTSEEPPAKLIRLTPNGKNIEKIIDDSGKVSSLSPRSPVDSLFGFINNTISYPPSNQESNELIDVISGGENDLKKNSQEEENLKDVEDLIKEKEEICKTKKVEVISVKVEKDKDEQIDNSKKDVSFETYNTLMNSPFLEVWDEDKDEYLVNFIIKNTNHLHNDLAYYQLLAKLPNIFKETTPAMLRERILMLSSVKNYFYLMKLCGGDHLKSEKEKCIFIARVEKLRQSMKSIEKKIKH